GTHIMYTLGAFSAGELFTRDINGNDPTPVSFLNVEKHFDGNADWATNFPPKCEARTAHIGANQSPTITLACTTPNFASAPPPPPRPGLRLRARPADPPPAGPGGARNRDGAAPGGNRGHPRRQGRVYTRQELPGHRLLHLHRNRWDLERGAGERHDPGRQPA